MQNFASVNINNIRKTPTLIAIKITDQIKTSGHNKAEPILLLPDYPDQKLYPASTLESHLEFSQYLRKSNGKLFISARKLHQDISSQTLNHWVKGILAESKIDTGIFSAHST